MKCEDVEDQYHTDVRVRSRLDAYDYPKSLVYEVYDALSRIVALIAVRNLRLRTYLKCRLSPTAYKATCNRRNALS